MYPNRLSDLEVLFGLSSAVLSNIIHKMINLIHQLKGNLFENLNNVPYLIYQKFRQYAEVSKYIPKCMRQRFQTLIKHKHKY